VPGEHRGLASVIPFRSDEEDLVVQKFIEHRARVRFGTSIPLSEALLQRQDLLLRAHTKARPPKVAMDRSLGRAKPLEGEGNARAGIRTQV
jgi:hypothetical protein